jgi:hypothetical protein
MAIVIEGVKTIGISAVAFTRDPINCFVSVINSLASRAKEYAPLPALTDIFLFATSIALYTTSGFGNVVAALSK